MVDIKLVVKMDQDEMDVEETFGPGISAPLNPAPETEVGVGGLGETDDEGIVSIPGEEVPSKEDEEGEQW